MTDASAAPSRDPALALARLHLRLGAFVAARAELETLAGRGALDGEGLVDLAEARWRTGDLPGAGDAARLALETGREDVVAYVVAAEAMADAGRPGEARRLASRALEISGFAITDVFAGMPRAAVWPDDPADTPTLAGLFEEAGARQTPAPATSLPAAEAGAAAAATAGSIPAVPGLWDDVSPPDDLPDPSRSLDAGRAALKAGDAPRAALHLSLALRLAPALAPVVLELVRSADAPELALVRGDAYRLVGHERDARLAFANAAAAIAGREPADHPAADHPPKEES